MGYNEKKGKYNDNLNAKKLRSSAFPKTEEKFMKYVRWRERLFANDKFGLNWAFMQAKAKRYNINSRMYYVLYVSNAYIQI